MKFYLQNLKDTTVVDETIDFSNHIQHQVDLLKIAPTRVTGNFRSEGEYIVGRFNIKTLLVMACAKTLKPVDVPLDFDTELVFGSGNDAEYPITQPLDLTDIIFGQILSEKPYTVYHLDAQNISFEEKKGPHPAFQDLDKSKNT
jgi:uncharacterized metal-binding protein YceD (DUF177 family)